MKKYFLMLSTTVSLFFCAINEVFAIACEIQSTTILRCTFYPSTGGAPKEFWYDFYTRNINYDSQTNTWSSYRESVTLVTDSEQYQFTHKDSTSSTTSTYDRTTANMTSSTDTYSNGHVYYSTYDKTTGKRTSYTYKNLDGSGYSYTYDPTTERQTGYTQTYSDGFSLTTSYDGNGTSRDNITGRVLTDSRGNLVTGTVVTENATYTAENGAPVSMTQTYSSGGGYSYTYDPTTGKTTGYTNTNSDGSGYSQTYDLTTGKETSYTRKNSDGSGYSRTYDPTTGKTTSHTDIYSDGFRLTASYDGNGTSENNITGRVLTDSSGNPVTGTVVSENVTYTAENGALVSITHTNSNGSSYTDTYDPTTGRQTSYTSTNSDGFTLTTSYDGNGTSKNNITGRVLTDPSGNPVTGTIGIDSGLYTAENGLITKIENDYSITTYDPATGLPTRAIFQDGKDGCPNKEIIYENGVAIQQTVIISDTSRYYCGASWSSSIATQEYYNSNKIICKGDMEKCKSILGDSIFPCLDSDYVGYSSSCKVRDYSKLVPADESYCYGNYYWSGYSCKRKALDVDCGDEESITVSDSEVFQENAISNCSNLKKIVCLGDMEKCKINLADTLPCIEYVFSGYSKFCKTRDYSMLVPSDEYNCNGSYYWNGSSCKNKNSGIRCDDNFKLNGDFCNRVRYTPAEAAAIATDDNNNVVTITFKK